MNKKDKIKYLIDYHSEDYKKALKESIEECDSETPMFCYCRRLATTLHVSRCKSYNEHVDTKIIAKLKHLLPTKKD